MALTQVTGPYPIFTDLDGSPLDDGYLYIGEVNQDPETNPIQVYWDSALTIPATQPIRTNSGYAWRNGTPALIYTAGQFSITIRNKKQEFVLYSPVGYGFDPGAVSASVVKNDFTGDGVTVDFALSASPSTKLATSVFINGVYQEKDSYSILGNVLTFTVAPPLSSSVEVMTNETGVIGSTNASLVSYTAGFTGAVQQTVQTKLEQYVSVKDFGAVGDGVTDDTAAIQAALDAAVDGSEVFFPGGEYLITSGLTCDAYNLTLAGRGGYSKSMIVCATASVQMLTIGGYGFEMRNLSLRGDGGANGTGATVKGIRFVRDDASKDVDAKIIDSTIGGMAECVYMQGANLLISTCLLSSSLLGVNFVQNGSDESRGLRAINNRFHSMGTIGLSAKCVVLNTNAFDCEVKGNFADSIYSFYEGPINGIEVDDNNCYRVSGPCVNVLTATNLSQQRCGSVNNNLIFCNAPSYVGNAITLRMQNGQCIGNSIIGPRENGIELISTTGSIVTDNNILAPNFNSAVDGSIYDGIKADAGSTTNYITDNHIRSAGVAAQSALNISSSNNIIGPHWIDPAYATPYFAQKPTLAVNTNGIGVKKAASSGRVFDALGTVMRIQQPDAISANPVEYQAAFTVAGTEIQGAAVKFPVQSSGAGVEKVNTEIWNISNGSMAKMATFDWQKAFYLPQLSTAPSTPVTGMLALSDGTAGGSGWGGSGAGYYRWNGSAWVFVG